MPLLNFLLADDRSFMERFRDWPISLADIPRWFFHWASYYIDAFGWKGYAVVFAGLVIVGLSLDLTHNLTSQILSGTYRALLYAVLGAAALLLRALWVITGNYAVARARDALRFWEQRLRPREPTDRH